MPTDREREKLVEEMVTAATGEYPSRWISSISMSAALTVAESAFARREDEMRADEREACAVVCDQHARLIDRRPAEMVAAEIAAAIRARKEGA